MGGPGSMAGLARQAAEEEPYELWDTSLVGAAPDLRCLGTQQPRTLRSAKVVRMAHMSIRAHKAVALAREWQLPRAFDSTAHDSHYASAYADLAVRRAAFARIARDARHPAVPPDLQDAVCRLATSSFPMGDKTKGWKKEPDHWRCARSCCAGGPHVSETLEHAFCDCPTVAAFTRSVISRWNANTGERLDATDKRVVMLGDRGSDTRQATEEPWRVVHAAMVDVIWRTSRKAKKETTDSSTPASMLRRVREDITRLARLRWRTLNSQRNRADFDAAWDAACDVRLGGALVVHVLDDFFRTAACDARPARRVYTDGSMRTKERNARAGWAAVTVDFVDKIVSILPGENAYSGATRHSNNTGELTSPPSYAHASRRARVEGQWSSVWTARTRSTQR
jgi:hypothetical protein